MQLHIYLQIQINLRIIYQLRRVVVTGLGTINPLGNNVQYVMELTYKF